MSTRFYPRFVRGNPQLRIFLPDWPLIMIKPNGLDKIPDNVVTFKTDPRMTDWDIKNYLEKIYKIPVAAIKSRIICGPIRASRDRKRPFDICKEEDYRIAQVTLPIGQTFKWPDLYPEQVHKEELTEYDRLVKEMSKDRKEWFQSID